MCPKNPKPNTQSRSGKLGILVGGGPAPGINSVIAAATIRGSLKGYEVVGVQQGFRHLMRGDTSHTMPLEISNVSRIHFRGGSILGTARDNPTTDPDLLTRVSSSLKKLGIDKLITIGGDDTCYSAMRLEDEARGRLRVVHVPKTIDNDLDLPHGQCTFGFQTARHLGAKLLKNLMIDAKSTARWFLVISMGRKAGHLALGIGKAAGATVTVIPEEFGTGTVRLRHVADVIAGTVIKRLSLGRPDGVAIIAEGLIEKIDTRDLAAVDSVERDAHGHIEMSEVPLATVVRGAVLDRLAEFGIKTKLTAKDIGYELRCAEPIPFDLEYTRDLGFCAAQFIANGGTGAMISIDNGRFRPLYFKDVLDPKTNRTRVRMIDIASEYYHIARRYMLRLHRTDFEERRQLTLFAKTCGISPARFHKEFHYLIENDPLHRIRDERLRKKPSIEDVMTPF